MPGAIYIKLADVLYHGVCRKALQNKLYLMGRTIDQTGGKFRDQTIKQLNDRTFGRWIKRSIDQSESNKKIKPNRSKDRLIV